MNVQIIGNNGKKTLGKIQIQTWNQKQRILRALKFWGMCWAAGVVCIFIPLLHFILVPAFLFAGPIVGFILYGQQSVISGGEGICPNCNAVLPIARASSLFPITELCTRCQTELKVDQLDA